MSRRFCTLGSVSILHPSHVVMLPLYAVPYWLLISWWLRWLQGHISGLKMVFSPFSILFLSSQAGFFKISSRYFYNSRRVAMGIFYVWWWWRTNHWCCWRWRGSTITPTLWWPLPPTFWFWWTTQSTKSIVHFTLSPLHCVAVQLTFCARLNIAVTCHY